MAITAEQQSLMTAITDRIAQFQDAAKRALPGNTALHAEFGVGRSVPPDPAGLVAFARDVVPAANEYRSVLLQRGIDAARIVHFGRMVADLERLVVVPAPQPPTDTAPAENTSAEPAPERARPAKAKKPAKKK